jgi:hypothetical protein
MIGSWAGRPGTGDSGAAGGRRQAARLVKGIGLIRWWFQRSVHGSILPADG